MNPTVKPLVSRRDILLMAGLGAAGVGTMFWRRYQIGARYFNPMALDDFSLPSIEGMKNAGGEAMPGFSAADLKGKTALVAIFASWCPWCREERGLLAQLIKSSGVAAYGVMVADKPDAAVGFFHEQENAFAGIGDDSGSYFLRMMGGRGVPLTFVVADGRDILFKTYGPLRKEDEDKLRPLLVKV